MKFKELKIHNIASIEDATINFDQQPLSTSDVFLITGRTGAGKTTILDAICLALYDNTPRFKHSEMSNSNDVDSGVGVRDVRQVMRRNTGEASVELTFVANDDVTYKAHWSVHRAGNEADGNMQDRRWTLTNLETDEVFSYIRDIQREVPRIIGLDFEQFCRTTMLAQGEFTRFLNSNDKEKADILEKITGMDIYSKIGAKIFEVCKQKRIDFETAQNRMEGVTVLTQEELDDLHMQLKALDNDSQKLKKEKDELDVKRTWIDDEQKVKTELARLQEDSNKAREVCQSDEITSKQLLVKQWNETIDARAWLNNMADAKTKLETEQAKWKSEEVEFASCRDSIAADRERLEGMEKEHRELVSSLEAQAHKVAVYDNAQTIGAKLATVIEGGKSIEAWKKQQTDIERNLSGSLHEAEVAAQGQVKLSQDNLDKLKGELAQEEDLLKTLDLPSKRNAKDEKHKELTAIASARIALNTLTEKQKHAKDLKDKINERTQKIQELTEQETAAKQDVAVAETALDGFKRQKELFKFTADELTKQMRSSLHIGDKCPVCGKEIDSLLHGDDGIDQMYQEACAQVTEAEQKLTASRDVLSKIEAKLNLLRGDNNKDRAELADNKELTRAHDRAAKALSQWNIVPGDDAVNRLDKEEGAIKDVLASLDAEIKDGAAHEDRRGKLQRDVNAAISAHDKNEKALRKAQDDIKDARAKKDSLADQQRIKQGEVDSAKAEVETLLAGSDEWKYDYQKAPAQFRDEVKVCAHQYKVAKERRDRLATDINNKKGIIERVQPSLEGIVSLRQQWKQSTLAGKVVDDYESKVNRLMNKCTEIDTNEKAYRATIAEAQQCVNEFVAANSAYNETLLRALTQYSASAVNAMDQAVKSAFDASSRADALLQQCRGMLQQHMSVKPELKQEDTLESLGERITKVAGEYAELQQSIGSINQRLVDDKANNQKIAKIKQEVEAASIVHERWNELNNLLGDKEGKKFKSIAQSYVLALLIDKANYYMNTLTDRYTLHVTPGTFVISIEDAYQGFVRRAVSTISGGESFLVSLSLALALSDMGHRLSVDTLFIDEGFGTLSGDPLNNAINTLRQLHNDVGRHVGIISHIDELRERIPVQIVVDQQGQSSASKVSVKSI